MVLDGAEQWLKPMAHPPFAAGFLSWFHLIIISIVCATVLGLSVGDVLGIYPAFGAKKPPPFPRVLYFETFIIATKSMEKQTQILSSAGTNISKVILRFIKKY